VSDIKQRREIRDSNAIFADSPATRAAINGSVLILDGIEKAERNVLSVRRMIFTVLIKLKSTNTNKRQSTTCWRTEKCTWKMEDFSQTQPDMMPYHPTCWSIPTLSEFMVRACLIIPFRRRQTNLE
jgi:hypothetical protein